MENYVKKFHNLGGETISAHKKAFSLFLKDLQQLKQQDLDALIAALKPENVQEEIFYVYILLTHEKHEILLELLPSGNKILNKIIAKDKTFIKYLSENIPASEFVDVICPKISYVSRCNLINGLARVLEIGDEHFFKVREVYGLKQALSLLVSCSEKVIKDVVGEFGFLFNDSQLIKIHKKYKNFMQFYFKTTGDRLNVHEEFVRYLLKEDVSTFEKLRVNYGIPKIGKRTFIHYFKTHRKQVLENSVYFNSNYKVICYSLNKLEYNEYLKFFFAKDLDKFHFNQMIYKILSRAKLEDRGTLFFTIYKDLYGQEYKEINIKLLELLSIEDRQHFDLEKNYVFYPVTKSIPLIQEKINFSSDIDARTKLVKELFVTCKLNRDEQALLDVLKYCQRFKNDNTRLRIELVESLIDSFTLEKLSDRHWEYITEFLLIFKVNQEDFYDSQRFLEKLILNKFERNLEFLEELRWYAEDIGVKGYRNWRILTDFPKIERKILLEYPKILDSWKKEDEVVDGKIMYLNTIADFNKSNKKFRISLFGYEQYLRDTMREIYENYFWIGIVKDLLKTTVDYRQDVLRDEIINRYIRGKATSRSVYYWLLKYKPGTLKEITHRIITSYGYFDGRFYYELNKMHYTDLPRVFDEEALKIFNDTEELAVKPWGIQQLSYREDFFEIIKKFEPNDCTVELRKFEMNIILQVQRQILKSLKNFAKPSTALEVILKYCKKDYLQYALEPLYHCLYHVSQTQVEGALRILLSRAVSVRKHAIFLATNLGSVKYICDVLNSNAKVEKNASVKKFIFRCIYKTFLGNPTEESFSLIANNLCLINEKDDESLDLLVHMNKIPKRYQSRYVETIWTFTKSLDKQLEFIIVTNLSEKLIYQLPDDLLNEILTHSLFNPKNNEVSSTNRFTYYYLFPSDTISIRTNTLFSLIKTYSESLADIKTKLMKISGLINDICYRIFEDKNKEIPEYLTKAFKETNLSIPTIPMKILVDYTNFYVRNEPTVFHKYFLDRLKSMVNEYGSAIVQFFMESSKDFLEKIYWESSDRLVGNIKFAEDLLNIVDSVEGKLVILNLVPSRSSTKRPDYLKRIDRVLEEITKEPLVQIYYSRYLLK